MINLWYIDIVIWGEIFSQRCKIWTTNLSLEIYRWIPLRMKEFGDKIKSFLWYLFLIDDKASCTWNNTLQFSPSGSFHYRIITNGLRSIMFEKTSAENWIYLFSFCLDLDRNLVSFKFLRYICLKRFPSLLVFNQTCSTLHAVTFLYAYLFFLR